MRLPRDLSGDELAHLLGRLGYEQTRQTGSHIRLTTLEGSHHVTVPRHASLKVGTLAGILSDVASHFDRPRREIERELFDE